MIIVPFDFNPISISVKTSSYTIPAGKFVRVYVEVDSGGIFTINGSNAVTSSAFLNVDVSVGSAVATYNTPANYRSIASFRSAGDNDSMSLNGNVINTSSASSRLTQEFSGGPSSAYSISNVSGQTKSIQGVSIPSNATNRQAEFWIPSGTVISGSGSWRAVVSEYNQIT